MNPNIQSLHNEAMQAADIADMAKRHGNPTVAKKCLLEAATLESKAAELTVEEPSRTILLNSAEALLAESQAL
jgi:hypothetical protein